MTSCRPHPYTLLLCHSFLLAWHSVWLASTGSVFFFPVLATRALAGFAAGRTEAKAERACSQSGGRDERMGSKDAEQACIYFSVME